MIRKAILATALFCIGIATAPAQQGREFSAIRQNTVVAQQPRVLPGAGRFGILAIAKKRQRALELRTRLTAQRIDLGQIDRARMPILLNRRDDMLPNLRLFLAQDHYTASTKLGNAIVEINGTRVATEAPRDFRMPRTIPRIRLNNAEKPAPQQHPLFHLPQGQPTPPPAQPAEEDALTDVNIEHTVSGVDITFTRFGHTYNITMDCGNQSADPEAIGPATGEPAGDASCTDQNALALAQDLEVAGGGESGP
jgi:hypothetical protein